MDDLRWWANLKEGGEYLFSYLFIDRVGSTKDLENHTREEAAERAAFFHQVVEDKAASFNGICLEWHGDGTTAFFYTEKPDSLVERSRILSKKAVDCALAITSELVGRNEIKAYMSIHLGLAPFQKKLGKMKAPELDVGGHMLGACPQAGILIHQDAFQALPDQRQKQFRYLGTTKRDSAPVFVYPKQREVGEKKRKDFLSPESDHYESKKKYLDYLGERYGKLVPRGLRQERLVSVDLFHIFTPLKVRRKEERWTPLAESFFPEAIDLDLSSVQKELAPFPVDQKAGRVNRNLFPVEKTSPPLAIKDVLAREKHSVILGAPGSGKSTLLSWLALSCAKGRISAEERLGLQEELLPVPVSVGHLAHIWATHKKNMGLLEAVVEYYKVLGLDISSFIHEEIQKRKALFLLDGMDEIQQDLDRREVARWIESFLQANCSCRCVVTSRIIGFPGLSIPGGNEYTIEELTFKEAKPLVGKWMVALAQAQRGKSETAERMGVEEAEKLTKLLESTPQLAPFIANPFLLTLTVLVHKLEARLPNYRIQLFERMIQTLVETWHQARGLSIIQPEGQRMDFRAEAIPVFAPLALWMHENYPAGTVPERELIDFLSNKLKEQNVHSEDAQKGIKEFLKKVKDQAGLLEEKGRGVWGFSHLAFEEYLCAVELVREDLYNEYLDQYRYHSRWEEVLVLVASELGITQASSKKVSRYIENIWKGTGDEIHEEMLKRHVLLAGRCVGNTANVEKKLVEEITDRLITFHFRFSFGSLENRVEKTLKDMLSIPIVMEKVKSNFWSLRKNRDKLNHRIALYAVVSLEIAEDWVMKTIEEDLKDKANHSTALNAACSLGVTEDWVVKAIQGTLHGNDLIERHYAFLALAKLGITEAWVIKAAQKDLKSENILARFYALLALSSLKVTDDWTIEAIREGMKDEDKDIRSQALSTLGSLEITEDWAIKAIKKAVNDKDYNVRSKAFSVLGSLGIAEDWAIEAIQKGLRNKLTSFGALSAIADLGIKEDWAIKAIQEGLRSPARFQAFDALAKLEVKEQWAMDAVLMEMKKPNSDVKRSAYEALWTLTEVPSDETHTKT